MRIDEQLRLKISELENITPQNLIGYSINLNNEIISHIKLLINMRCFIVNFGRELFGHPIISNVDIFQLKTKASSMDRSYLNHLMNFIDIVNFSSNELWAYLTATSDRLNTERYFKKMLQHALPLSFCPNDRANKIDSIVKNVIFKIE